ncbi:cytochrome b-c1 complex subunit Rieske-4, mitochondrial-like, partial [Nymphaea colorata]|uniref:cytochrome b-c1 complex subunit Rieske-4, mitochondrial-like n=1 Tax=Nymphaea colorata TaxID=210225 RepID=UPI00214F2133
ISLQTLRKPLVPENGGLEAIPEIPPTVSAVKNPTPKISYDESTHERLQPGADGDPSRRAFAYLVLSGGRFVYASLIRLLVLKSLLCMSPSRDVLALSSLEVDLSAVEPGAVLSVKWQGKPVFLWHRTEEDIRLANAVDLSTLRYPQPDLERVIKPEWLVVVGVCTHLGCIPLPHAGDFGGWFCPCHGSHYDSSGKTRKGPAPYNLEVPAYRFLNENKGVDRLIPISNKVTGSSSMKNTAALCCRQGARN